MDESLSPRHVSAWQPRFDAKRKEAIINRGPGYRLDVSEKDMACRIKPLQGFVVPMSHECQQLKIDYGVS